MLHPPSRRVPVQTRPRDFDWATGKRDRGGARSSGGGGGFFTFLLLLCHQPSRPAQRAAAIQTLLYHESQVAPVYENCISPDHNLSFEGAWRNFGRLAVVLCDFGGEGRKNRSQDICNFREGAYTREWTRHLWTPSGCVKAFACEGGQGQVRENSKPFGGGGGSGNFQKGITLQCMCRFW